MIRRSWVQILAEFVIVGVLGKSISTALNTKGHCQLMSSLHQWAPRLYAPWGVEVESGMNRPNDLEYIVQLSEQYHWMWTNTQHLYPFIECGTGDWYINYMYILTKVEIKDKLLAWYMDYLKDRVQRVTIKGQHSEWLIKSWHGIPHGSVLGSLLFLIFMNDLTNIIECCNIVRMFRDSRRWACYRNVSISQSSCVS